MIGRKVEDRIIAKAAELLRARGVGKMTGEYIPTRRNGLVASFYDDHGFSPVSQEQDGRKLYERTLS